jgi:hypothetical protein
MSVIGPCPKLNQSQRFWKSKIYLLFGFLQVIAEVTTAIGLFHSTWKQSDYISHKTTYHQETQSSKNLNKNMI